MPTTNKRGFIPVAPLVLAPPNILEYKHWGEFVNGLFRTAVRTNNIELIMFARSANVNRSRAIMRFMDRKLFKLGFKTAMVDRLSLALGEVIPNAFQHALPRSQVSITFVIYGQAPNRFCTLIVSNFLDYTREGAPPSPAEIKDFEQILFETHGRGIGIVQQIAKEMTVAYSKNFEVTTVAQFQEEE